MRFPLRFLIAFPLSLIGCGSSNNASPVDASAPDSSATSDEDGGKDATGDAGADATPSCGTLGATCCTASTCSGSLFCKSGTCQAVPTPISVDLVNVSLDAPTPFSSQRAPYVYKDIAGRTTDLVCVVGVGNLSDRTKIAQAAAGGDAGAGHFPYSYMVTTDVSSAPSNPADVEPAPASPPCGAAVSATAVSDVYTCVEQNCSTVGGGDPGGTGSLNGTTECLVQACAAPLSALYSPVQTSPQQTTNDACFDCIVDYLEDGETIATGKSNCTTQAAAPLAYEGQTPVVILSDRPIVSSTSYTLGSTDFRRAILKVQVVLANGEPADFFCGDVTSPLLDQDLPYTGAYGSEVVTDGGVAGNGWEQEQDHQASEAVAWIQQQIAADKVPAIIAMDLHASDALGANDAGAVDNDGGAAADGGDDGGAAADGGDDGGSGDDAGAVPDPSALSPEVVDQFKASFTPTLPAAQAATCDFCPAPENPYNGGTPPHQMLHVFLSGFPAGATMSETLWGNDSSEVPLTSGPDQSAPASGRGPLLEYYGHEVTVLAP